MNIRTLLWLGLMLAAVPSAFAQEKPDCDNAQTQAEMNACAGLAFKAADKRLNALWPEVVANAKAFDAETADLYAERGVPSSFEALREAQRAWIAFRDRQCEYEAYAAFGGSMQPMLGSDCRTRLTEERIATFREILSGE